MTKQKSGKLSGPTATVIVLHCRATLYCITFPDLERYTPSKGPVAPTFSALKGGVVLPLGRSRGTVGCRNYTVMGHLAVKKSALN